MSQDFDFQGVFDNDYIYFYEQHHPTEVNRATAEKIVSLLDNPEGKKILDVPCGYGRISNELADMGFDVTGVDITETFLQKAKADAKAKKLNIEYLRGDMRRLPFENQTFDVLINWFTSFGYFDEETNHAVLKEFHRVLKPGAILLLDHQNRDRMLLNFGPYSLNEKDGNFMIDAAEFDPVSGYAPNQRIIIRDGKVRRTQFSVRMFAASELALWLKLADFENVRITDIDGEPFTVTSRRMVVRATAG